MAKKDSEQEPSIEEILTSIRQIISDDDDTDSDSDEDDDDADEETYESDDDTSFSIGDDEAPEEPVIELTDIVEEAPKKAAPPPPPPAPEPEPVQVDLKDIEEDFTPAPSIDAPRPAPAASTEKEDDDFESILTSTAQKAALQGFGALVRKTAVEYGGITLEEIVRTELNPLLREWLDRHLPSLIERLVQEELERISRRVMDD